jgi:hypothetical protein
MPHQFVRAVPAANNVGEEIVPFDPVLSVNHNGPAPISRDDLTGRKLFTQYYWCELDEIIRRLSRLAIFGASDGHPDLPMTMAASIIRLADCYSLDELSQLNQLHFLRH